MQPRDEEPDRVGDEEERLETEALKEISGQRAVMGWYRRVWVDRDVWAAEVEPRPAAERRVFKMVEPLQRLERLAWNYVGYYRCHARA